MDSLTDEIARDRTQVRPGGLSALKVIGVIWLCLLTGLLAINYHFRSIAINGIGVLIVTGILYWVLYAKRDPFSFLLIVFICSQFGYANNQGGLFNLATFALLLPYILTKSYRETRQPPDILMATLLIILFIANMLGLFVINPLPTVLRVEQAAAFSGFLMAFILASHLRLDVPRLKKMLIVIGVFVLYNFFVSMNQNYTIIKMTTPLLGMDENVFAGTENSFGTFRSASSNGQYAMIIYAFIVPLLASSAARARLSLKPIIFGGICFFCLATAVLSNMRAAVTEIAMLTAIYIIMFSIFYRRSFRYAKYLNRFTIAAGVFLLAFGVVIGLDDVIDDFQLAVEADEEEVFSGEVFNRLGAWEHGLTLLSEKSWILGYGHGASRSNAIATGGTLTASGVIGGGHLHNLYLMLPMIYGWIGSLAFMGIFILPLAKSFSAIRKMSFDNLFVVVNLGFFVSITTMMLDEIKSGNIVQKINYPMLYFIWLGWAVAAQRTLRFNAIMQRKEKKNHE